MRRQPLSTMDRGRCRRSRSKSLLAPPPATTAALLLLLLLLASSSSAKPYTPTAAAAAAFVSTGVVVVVDRPAAASRGALVKAAAAAAGESHHSDAVDSSIPMPLPSPPPMSSKSKSKSKSSSLLTPREARVAFPMSSILTGGGLGLLAGGLPSAALAEDLPPAALPSSGGNFQTSLRRYFPTSFESPEIASRILRTLNNDDEGRSYFPGSVLFGTSLCADEINYTPQSLGNRLAAGLTGKVGGGVFNLGGLGGLPFVGTSGFGAFFSHCPNSNGVDGGDPDGKVVILFGPHVGIAQDGTVGKVERIGRRKPSTSCGAAIGAYKALIAQKKSPKGLGTETKDVMTTGMSGYEFQENYILNQLRSKLTTYGDGTTDVEMALVTYRTYELVYDLLRAELADAMNAGSVWENASEVILLGGIVINQGRVKGSDTSGRIVEDYFQPVTLQRWKPRRGAAGFRAENLFDEAFGS